MTVPMIQKKINSYEKRLDIVYKRLSGNFFRTIGDSTLPLTLLEGKGIIDKAMQRVKDQDSLCLLYTSPSPRDGLLSRMPSSA